MATSKSVIATLGVKKILKIKANTINITMILIYFIKFNKHHLEAYPTHLFFD